MDFGPLLVAASLALLLLSLAARRTREVAAPLPLFTPDALLAALARGEIDEVELALRARVEGAVHTPLDRLQLAQVLVLRGAYRKAQAVMQGPTAPAWRGLSCFVEAEILALDADPARALPAISTLRAQALPLLPASARPRMLAAFAGVEGVARARAREDDLAIELLARALDQALHTTPTRVIYLFHLARVRSGAGEETLARARYAEVVRGAPGTVWADVAALHLRGSTP